MCFTQFLYFGSAWKRSGPIMKADMIAFRDGSNGGGGSLGPFASGVTSEDVVWGFL